MKEEKKSGIYNYSVSTEADVCPLKNVIVHLQVEMNIHEKIRPYNV